MRDDNTNGESKMEKFRVIVGSIGTVYAGGIERIAEEKYAEHLGGPNRALLLQHGMIKAEYIGNGMESKERVEHMNHADRVHFGFCYHCQVWLTPND